MRVERVNEIGEGFSNLLKLKTMPLGINFFPKTADIPAEYKIVEKRKVICNLIGFSRYYGIAVAATKETTGNLCVVADISLGFGRAPDDFAERTVGAFARSREETGKMLKGMLSLGEGKYEALGVCPLDKILLVPDVVQIWGNPMQMLELEYAHTWNHGDGRIELSTNGHGGSCYEVLTWPVIDNKVRMAVADMGDRRHGFAQDDEMILGVPIGELESLYDGLEHTLKTLNRIPILYNFDDIPFPVPSYVLEHSPNVERRKIFED
jgi:uncharacterized protein (DUF169 family)